MESARRMINVTKAIGPTTAVADISFSAAPGEVLGLVGLKVEESRYGRHLAGHWAPLQS